MLVITRGHATKFIFGDGIRIAKILESLHKLGIHVTNIRLPSITRDNLSEYKSLKTILVNLFPPRKSYDPTLTCASKGIKKQIELNVSLNQLVRTLTNLKPDVLLAETSEVGWITTIAARRFSIPCIIDVHGLVFSEARGWKHRDWQQILNMEKEAFENCDHLIVVSEKMKEYLSKELGIPNNKMTVAPNGSDPQRRVAKYETPLKVVYAGIFSYWERVNDFLDIAKQANEKTLKFYLAGTGPMKDQLIKRIREEKIPVSYLGYIPRQQIHRLLAQMQIGIAPSTRDLARQVASPIKIFDYMASGLPVVTPRIGDWGDIIEKDDCGIAMDSDSVENYLRALNTLAQENIWTTKSRNAIKSIEEKYSWSKVLEPVSNLLLAYAK